LNGFPTRPNYGPLVSVVHVIRIAIDIGINVVLDAVPSRYRAIFF